jgi:hypothetical protein
VFALGSEASWERDHDGRLQFIREPRVECSRGLLLELLERWWASGFRGCGGRWHRLAERKNQPKDGTGAFDAPGGLAVAEDAGRLSLEVHGDVGALDPANQVAGGNAGPVGEVPLGDDAAGHIFPEIRYFNGNGHALPPPGVKRPI